MYPSDAGEKPDFHVLLGEEHDGRVDNVTLSDDGELVAVHYSPRNPDQQDHPPRVSLYKLQELEQ